MDATDKKILNIIQDEFPLEPRPFESIGRLAGIGEEEALVRVRDLSDKGYIRRIGLVSKVRSSVT